MWDGPTIDFFFPSAYKVGGIYLLPGWFCSFQSYDRTYAMHNICKYKGEQHIQITNDSALPITEIGTLRSSFNNAFASTDLST